VVPATNLSRFRRRRPVRCACTICPSHFVHGARTMLRKLEAQRPTSHGRASCVWRRA
jgi:hypothetical protein